MRVLPALRSDLLLHFDTDLSARVTHEGKSRGFRHVLRDESRGLHDDAESAFSWFEADPVGTMSRFLSAHASAVRHLFPALASHRSLRVRGASSRLKTALEKDCAQRDLEPSKLAMPPCDDPLAAAYVVLGSRLGVEAMRRTWAMPSPLPAYMGRIDVRGAWSASCAALDRIEPGSIRAREVMQATVVAFRSFQTSALQA